MGGSANDKFDTSTPPTNVTDAARAGRSQEVLQPAREDTSTIYEVFIPSTSYSSTAPAPPAADRASPTAPITATSPTARRDVKYSIEPYPSCSGCQISGFTPTQNADHFVIHETREAISDPGPERLVRPPRQRGRRQVRLVARRRSSTPTASPTSTSGRTQPAAASSSNQQFDQKRKAPRERGFFISVRRRPPVPVLRDVEEQLVLLALRHLDFDDVVTAPGRIAGAPAEPPERPKRS